MRKSAQAAFILRKSYEISYAISRILPYITSPHLKERLEGQAFALIDAAAVENYSVLSLVAQSIEYLIRLGSDTGVMNQANAETMIVELNVLNTAIAEPGNPANPAEVPLEGIFKEKIPPMAMDLSEVAIPEEHSNGGGILKSAMRQSAILDRIRQSGNCRLKDIQELLPEASERTLRYDLQSLVEQNLIERVGSGGPSVYYRARQLA